MAKRFSGNSDELAQVDAYVKLMRCADTVQGILARNAEANGLTLSQLGVLEILLHLGPQNQKDLAGKILRSGANMTTIIDNLEKRDFVRRSRDEADRRTIRVELTATGESLISAIFPLHMNNIYRMMGALNKEELETLANLTRKLGLAARPRMSV
ncbi:MarR family winged helix-turn-helix transcriptional regulator [Turneriella parva]|uniref:Transcriptional regulator, MarR family n=1 Tax=Turneriella parva (strain ATCC BAA-1111 / DSM 21527 / NCTC 11395 / H) TaxID=869212 RepID=I4B8R9_TURPD|nr:MarR family transcriptional regulator [Turneriella parva]AFM13676.1 transcriptional regulator, MarR family [Turneriella parva DSM 21527]